MSTQILNEQTLSAMMHGRRADSRDDAAVGSQLTDIPGARSARELTEPLQLQAVRAVGEGPLPKALRELEALRSRERVLTEQVAALRNEVARMHRFAYHDELTGLPNRRLLADRFEQAVARSERQRQVALLFLDLDGFKYVNDAYGHAAGDNVLQQVAARLSTCTRISDSAYRYGGDEFVLLLPDAGDGRECAVATGEKLRALMAVPYCVDSDEIALTASIGLAVYPTDGTGCSDLIRAADGAMYRAKGSRPLDRRQR